MNLTTCVRLTYKWRLHWFHEKDLFFLFIFASRFHFFFLFLPSLWFIYTQLVVSDSGFIFQNHIYFPLEIEHFVTDLSSRFILHIVLSIFIQNVWVCVSFCLPFSVSIERQKRVNFKLRQKNKMKRKKKKSKY